MKRFFKTLLYVTAILVFGSLCSYQVKADATGCFCIDVRIYDHITDQVLKEADDANSIVKSINAQVYEDGKLLTNCPVRIDYYPKYGYARIFAGICYDYPWGNSGAEYRFKVGSKYDMDFILPANCEFKEYRIYDGEKFDISKYFSFKDNRLSFTYNSSVENAANAELGTGLEVTVNYYNGHRITPTPTPTPVPEKKRVQLDDCTVTVVSAVAYTGKATKPSIQVKHGTTTLKEGTDYTVTLSNNVKLGNSAKVTITGKGDYTGTVTKTYAIQLAAPKLSSAKSSGFNAVTVSWKKVTGAKTYNLYYKGGTVKSWKLVKSGIKGTSYKHKTSKLLTGTKYTYTVRAVNGSNLSGYDKTGVAAAPALNKANLTKLASASKGIQITWAKVPGSSGYVVQRLNNGKWGAIKTITKGTTVTYTDTAVKAGGQYSYRVRAYRTVNGKRIYGAYSAAKMRRFTAIG